MPARTTFAGFPKQTLSFLAELGAHNDRAWFTENKDRYEAEVREPALAFIDAMAPTIGKVSKCLVADARKVGGSLMRPYRDTRFAKDKTPYKTNVGVQFRHQAGKDVHAPGIYVHIDNERCFLGIGIWHPDSPALNGIRSAIAKSGAVWKKARDDAAFQQHFTLEGDSLQRPPRGHDAEHPLIEDLKRKDHIAVATLTPKQVTSKKFVELIGERCQTARPFLRFLTKAVGLDF